MLSSSEPYTCTWSGGDPGTLLCSVLSLSSAAASCDSFNNCGLFLRVQHFICSTKGGVPLPFVLASAIPPIPGKIVQRIQAGEYVDMCHLLPGNVTLLDKLEGMPQSLLTLRPRHREITSLHTWTSCLLRMIAIQAATDPGHVAEICAYSCLIIREACTHGREGWVAYDTLFRQHAAAHSGTS